MELCENCIFLNECYKGLIPLCIEVLEEASEEAVLKGIYVNKEKIAEIFLDCVEGKLSKEKAVSEIFNILPEKYIFPKITRD